MFLTCTGTDSGLALDGFPADLPAGPYHLQFRVKSSAAGEGEIFWTTDAKTSLPNGERLPFEVTHDGEWHEVDLLVATDQPLVALRLDPCSAPGEVTVEGLKLVGSDGAVLAQWPVPKKSK